MKTRMWRLMGAGCLALVGGCAPSPPGGPGGPGGGYPASAVVGRVEERTLNEEVVATGTLVARDAVTVISELDAAVREIGFTEGQSVSKGQMLFRLDPVRTQAQLEEAQAAYTIAELSYERSLALQENGTISAQEFDQAESAYLSAKAQLALAGDQHSKTEIAAPFDGVAAEREVSVGQYVNRGQMLTSLIAIDPLELEFDIPERHLSKLEAGMEATFASPAYPEEPFAGEVTYVSPSVDRGMRTIRVKATLDNADARLRPGMFGDVTLVLARRDGVLVIPESAVQLLGGLPTVMAINEVGLSEFRQVTVGARIRGWLEVREGLSVGELVVVEGYQKMGPGMQVVATEGSAEYGVTPGPLTPTADAPARDGGVHATD